MNHRPCAWCGTSLGPLTQQQKITKYHQPTCALRANADQQRWVDRWPGAVWHPPHLKEWLFWEMQAPLPPPSEDWPQEALAGIGRHYGWRYNQSERRRPNEPSL